MVDTEQVYFDNVAKDYQEMETGSTPVRRYVEAHTALKLAYPLEGKSVLDVACSDGFFSRLLKRGGARAVTGIDLSPQMIGLALAAEQVEQLGIEYRVGNILGDVEPGQYDLVYSSFVLSYAKDPEELVAMCRALYRQLKPGGLFISMNDNPDMLKDSVEGFRKYGKTKQIKPDLVDGATITVTWEAHDGAGQIKPFSFDCRYYTGKTLVWAMEQVGFTDVRIHQPEVSPEGLEEFGAEFWELFLEHPLLVFITGGKGEDA